MIVARLHYDQNSDIRDGSVVKLHGDGRRWVVLSADTTLDLIAYDRRHPAAAGGASLAQALQR